MGEFWLTIPRASARVDSSDSKRESYIVYDVACCVTSSREENVIDRDRDRAARATEPRAFERITKRRFREFLALRADIARELGDGRDVPEAPKRDFFLRSRALDDERVERRRVALERWLWELLASEKCAKTEALAAFVRLRQCERAMKRAREEEGKEMTTSTTTATATMTAIGRESERIPQSTDCDRTERMNKDGEIQQLVEAVTRARADIGTLEEELRATRECLHDARALATAADAKTKATEATALKEKKILSKEIRSLRKQLERALVDENEQANIVSAKERAAALNAVLREASALRSRVQDCTYERLLMEEASGMRGQARGDPHEILSVSDNRLACLLAEAQILILSKEDAATATKSPEGAEAEAELLEAERRIRQMFADLLSDLINNRKSINSLLRKIAKKNETPTSADKIGQRVGNLIGDFANKLAIPQ